MAITYYPKLSDHAAMQIIEQMIDKSPSEISKLHAVSHHQEYFYETYSQRVSHQQLRELRTELISLAEAQGFPHSVFVNGHRKFDQKAATILGQKTELIPAEAASQEVWNFLTLVLLPDIAAWRFKNQSRHRAYPRWMGGPRNTFARLWWRDATLGSSLSSFLGEDEAVGIMERTNLSANPSIARAIVRAFQTEIEKRPNVARSEILRTCMVYLRMRFTLVDLDSFSEEQLDKRISDWFSESSRIAYGNPPLQVPPSSVFDN